MLFKNESESVCRFDGDFRFLIILNAETCFFWLYLFSGQKACTHVHGIFPYLYVPSDEVDLSRNFLRQFASSIDTAMNIALGRASAHIQHVFKITPVHAL